MDCWLSVSSPGECALSFSSDVALSTQLTEISRTSVSKRDSARRNFISDNDQKTQPVRNIATLAEIACFGAGLLIKGGGVEGH